MGEKKRSPQRSKILADSRALGATTQRLSPVHTLRRADHSSKSPDGDFTSAPTDESGCGHVYELAEELQAAQEAREEAEAARRRARRWTLEKANQEFPDRLWRIPIPNRVFTALPHLSGSAVRSLLLLIRATFRYDPAEGWVHDGRWKTRAQLEEAAERPGLSSRSIQKGVRTLAAAGLVEVDDRGHAHYYYLRLEAPESGYTWLPTPLIDRMGDLDSTAALKVFLIIYRATWGWTSRETRGHGKDALVHRRFVQLSNAELARRTGLSRPAVITAVSVLTSDGWVERDRLDRTEAFFFSPIGNFDREESLPPSSWEKNLSTNTRARNAESGGNPIQSAPAQCTHQGRSPEQNPPQSESHTSAERRSKPPEKGGKKSSRCPVPEGKTALYERLTEIGMSHAAAVKALYRRSEWLIESTIELYETSRRRGTVIENPGGWMNVALRETWAAKTKESPPDRSGRSRSERPLGQIFADLADGDGWELDAKADGATDSTDQPAMDTDTESQTEAAGLSRRDAIAFLEDHRLLGPGRPVTHWFDVEPGDPARFYPNERLQAWKEQNLD